MVRTLKWGTANGVANKCFCIYGDPAAPTNLKVKVQALSHCKNRIVNMTCSLLFWLQMSEPITHIDTDNCMTIHRKGTSYFHSTNFVHSFKRNDKLSFIVIIAYI